MKSRTNRFGSGLITFIVSILSFGALLHADSPPALESKPADPYFEKFSAVKAPTFSGLFLKMGDRLAICGDSITQQKRYSRLIEDYLTACQPDLKITARQYGWSGETADGFLNRMQSDTLRFEPTVATTCYGMNDYRYKPYDEAIAQAYRRNYTAVVEKFKAAGVRVIVGSPGCVGKVASWVKSASGTLEEHNLNLLAFRNIDIDIANAENVRFADVYWPMFVGGFEARKKYGAEYAMSGHDGVHPGWAGHLVMAYAYLHAMGLDGDLGTLTVDLTAKHADASAGHTVDCFDGSELKITSSRYPFCATGELNSDDSIRSGMTLVPFNQELNRLTLIVKGATAANYQITWGSQSRTYLATDLAKGINLTDDFAINPFSDAFGKVDEAVAAKEEFETKEMQVIMRSPEAQKDMAAVVAKSEIEHTRLADAVAAAMTPVGHVIRIRAQ